MRPHSGQLTYVVDGEVEEIEGLLPSGEFQIEGIDFVQAGISQNQRVAMRTEGEPWGCHPDSRQICHLLNLAISQTDPVGTSLAVEIDLLSIPRPQGKASAGRLHEFGPRCSGRVIHHEAFEFADDRDDVRCTATPQCALWKLDVRNPCAIARINAAFGRQTSENRLQALGTKIKALQLSAGRGSAYKQLLSIRAEGKAPVAERAGGYLNRFRFPEPSSPAILAAERPNVSPVGAFQKEKVPRIGRPGSEILFRSSCPLGYDLANLASFRGDLGDRAGVLVVSGRNHGESQSSAIGDQAIGTMLRFETFRAAWQNMCARAEAPGPDKKPSRFECAVCEKAIDTAKCECGCSRRYVGLRSQEVLCTRAAQRGRVGDRRHEHYRAQDR